MISSNLEWWPKTPFYSFFLIKKNRVFNRFSFTFMIFWKNRKKIKKMIIFHQKNEKKRSKKIKIWTPTLAFKFWFFFDRFFRFFDEKWPILNFFFKKSVKSHIFEKTIKKKSKIGRQRWRWNFDFFWSFFSFFWWKLFKIGRFWTKCSKSADFERFWTKKWYFWWKSDIFVDFWNFDVFIKISKIDKNVSFWWKSGHFWWFLSVFDVFMQKCHFLKFW